MKRNSFADLIRKLEEMPWISLDSEGTHKLKSFGIFMILLLAIILLIWLGG